MKVALCGATGRIGAALFSLIRQTGDTIVGACAAPGCVEIGHDLGEVHGAAGYGVAVQEDPAQAVVGADAIVDFSHPSNMRAVTSAAVRNHIPLVSGTTGLDEEGESALNRASCSVAVLWAPNFSLGVQVLAELVRLAITRLGPLFDVEVVEVHHRAKTDAPSGTALRLAKEAQSARASLHTIYGRQGKVGARPNDEMAVLAVRGGDVVGDHTVHLLGLGERLELTHRATSRELFARGALVSARALIGRKPGRYELSDVLGGA